jgi:hypothetical protein
MVNSSVGRTLYSEAITAHVRASIQEGIDSGDFALDSADVGRDIVLGTGISATISLLRGGTPPDYPERIARHVLLSLGTSRAVATAETSRPLRDLPRLRTNSRFFRGSLGDAELPAPQERKSSRASPGRPARTRSTAARRIRVHGRSSRPVATR